MKNKIKCTPARFFHNTDSLLTMQVPTCMEVIKCLDASSNCAHAQPNSSLLPHLSVSIELEVKADHTH
jgi:hypothetical protein